MYKRKIKIYTNTLYINAWCEWINTVTTERHTIYKLYHKLTDIDSFILEVAYIWREKNPTGCLSWTHPLFNTSAISSPVFLQIHRGVGSPITQYNTLDKIIMYMYKKKTTKITERGNKTNPEAVIYRRAAEIRYSESYAMLKTYKKST